MVEDGAHVLEGLAPESQVRQVDDGLLGDLEDRPPELARDEHRGLVIEIGRASCRERV